jgi:hypothetical protein
MTSEIGGSRQIESTRSSEARVGLQILEERQWPILLPVNTQLPTGRAPPTGVNEHHPSCAFHEPVVRSSPDSSLLLSVRACLGRPAMPVSSFHFGPGKKLSARDLASRFWSCPCTTSILGVRPG